MVNFIVTVVCAVHLGSNCPIPKGYHSTHQAESAAECVHKARQVIAGYGYQPTDFRISCTRRD